MLDSLTDEVGGRFSFADRIVFVTQPELQGKSVFGVAIFPQLEFTTNSLPALPPLAVFTHALVRLVVDNNIEK